MATPDQILAIRYELSDTDPSLPVMSDSEISYFIDKNSPSLSRAAVDTAKSLLFKLSYRTDSTVDVISLKGSKAAQNWIQALTLWLKDPSLNPLYNNLNGWAGNISVSEIEENNSTLDNNIPSLAVPVLSQDCTAVSDNPFSVC